MVNDGALKEEEEAKGKAIQGGGGGTKNHEQCNPQISTSARKSGDQGQEQQQQRDIYARYKHATRTFRDALSQLLP